MEQIIFDTATGITYPYPRADGAPVIGLDPGLVILQLIREPMPEPGEGFVITESPPVDDLVAGTRTIGWVVNKLPPPLPVPQWVAFGAFLVGDAQMNQFVVAVSQSAPILDRMITVGLGQAAQGDAQTFAAAWSAARQLGMVSPELIAHMQKAAANFDLPAEFIAGLASDPAVPE